MTHHRYESSEPRTVEDNLNAAEKYQQRAVLAMQADSGVGTSNYLKGAIGYGGAVDTSAGYLPAVGLNDDGDMRQAKIDKDAYLHGGSSDSDEAGDIRQAKKEKEAYLHGDADCADEGGDIRQAKKEKELALHGDSIDGYDVVQVEASNPLPPPDLGDAVRYGIKSTESLIGMDGHYEVP